VIYVRRVRVAEQRHGTFGDVLMRSCSSLATGCVCEEVTCSHVHTRSAVPLGRRGYIVNATPG
jgi:hypothetical protein